MTIGRDASSKLDQRRSRADVLLEVADPLRDPEGLITKFIRYESFRIHREKYEDDMVGTIADRLKILFWYLSDYVRDRHFDYVVPLSARQIEYLNAPAPIAGASPAVSIALHNFVLREIPNFANLADPAVLSEAVYWWCIEKSPRSKLETRLVTEEQVALLRTEIQWVGEDFAFNGFMTYYFNRHKELHCLDMRIPRDRAAFFYYLVLYAFAHPYILRFLPRESLRRVLQERDGTPCSLDRAIARFCISPTAAETKDSRLADARTLRGIGEILMAREGLRLDRDAPIRMRAADTGANLMPPKQPIGPLEPGVALLGPALKTSGLGQATRLSFDILKGCERVLPTVYNFDLDNPAPVGFASATSFTPYEAKREINLIHLNAESIPLAFAFEPRAIFAESYNIGYFFWELNQIPKCHSLALELLDEIWVSSEYNREIYARHTSKPVVNVGMAVEPLPEARTTSRASLGLDEDGFVFLTTFDSFSFIERKNPLGVIEAFRRAFPRGDEKAQLVIKTQNRFRVYDPHQLKMWKRIDAAVRAEPRILVVNETYTYKDLLGLKRACDCYVSLHRSEGWGFGMIEAMQLAKPVIATAYSGNMEFCMPETAFLVDHELVGVREEEYIFVERGSLWAQPNLDQAATFMRAAVADPAAAKVKGQAAAYFIKGNFSIEAIGRRYAARLAEVRAGL